ncbi:MAG: GntR family transcriptional regulator [Ilumatobacter sp.]|nr:GntR family transcriptional regulator [Ilumatobacter sp.]
MPLDRTSPMPLWAQLEAALRERLEAGEFDERFPTDGDLVDEYDVSRHTVREAIRHLNTNGILRRERGRGTVVTRSFDQPLGALYSLFASIESSGVEQRSHVLALRDERNGEVAEQLGVPVDEPLLFLERLRLADGEPLAIDRAWLPMSIAGALIDADFEHTALYEQLEQRCGVRPDAGWERISPVLPDPHERELLGMRDDEAAFFLERLSTAAGEVLEWRTTTIRGDRYRFVSNFGLGVVPALVASERR